MSKLINGVCYSAAIGTFLTAALSERDVLQWTGVAIAAGSSIFAWGIGRYHEFCKQKREEDHNDRMSMIEDVRAHTRILMEMESRQSDLQKSLDKLTLEIEIKRRKINNTDNLAELD